MVEKQENAENGDKVVALVEDCATIQDLLERKRLDIRLQPENDFMDPIVISPDQQFQVLGKVIKIFRFMK